MARIEQIDLPDRFSPRVPQWLTQVGFGVVCAVAIGVIRLAIDAIVVGAAPFALVFPAILFATLFGRWLAGTVTAILSIGYAYGFVYSATNSVTAGQAPLLSLVVVSIGAILSIAIADRFRRAVRRATADRDRQIADRDLFLAEFDHRVKNNFAIVASLLELQKRRAREPATVAALEAAQQRVDSIARAHHHLYRDASADAATVQISDYLGDLCAALADSLFLRGGIVLTCTSDNAAIPRDRAVSIGLIANELVTNAAKHAFVGRDSGTITVHFRNRPAGWELRVSDDGIGLSTGTPAATSGSGLGGKLIEAFARQAGGTLHTDSDATGTRVTLDLAA